MKHLGAISKITKSTITVSLEPNINCEGCKAKAACGASESQSKIVEVDNPHRFDHKQHQEFQLNETVDVEMQAQLGLKAVFWAYVFPFILMITVLMIASTFYSEWKAGLISLAVLLPYYLLIHFLNPFFKRRFKVSILKLT